MLCYKDRTYCNAGVLCKVYDCELRMTVADAEAARAQPFPVAYIDFTTAPCFVPFFSTSKTGKNIGKGCAKKRGKVIKRIRTGKKRTGTNTCGCLGNSKKRSVL